MLALAARHIMSITRESKKNKKVLDLLDEIESEMKKIGFWEENPPSIKDENYLETPSFELLPRSQWPEPSAASNMLEFPGFTSISEN